MADPIKADPSDVTLDVRIHVHLGQTPGAAALPVRPFAPLPGDLTVSTTTGATPLVNIQIVGKQTSFLSRSRSRSRDGDSPGKDEGPGAPRKRPGTPREPIEPIEPIAPE